MSICWYCHWGWPKQVADIYAAALLALDGFDSLLDYGPGHMVWADENFEDHHIKSCLEGFDESPNWPLGYLPTDAEKQIVRESLEKLLAVPEEIRCCEPDDYDDENPANFPPPSEFEMVRK